MRPRPSPRPASCNRRFTRLPRSASTGIRRSSGCHCVPRGARAQARRVARIPLPGARVRRRPGRDLAPVGVGDGQLSDLGRGALPDRPGRAIAYPTTSASTSSSPTRPSDRPTASTTATSISSASSASSTTDLIASTTRRRSRCSRCCSTRCSSRPIAISLRSRGRWARIPTRSSTGQSGRQQPWTPGSGARSTALYVDYDVRGGKPTAMHLCGRSGAALRRDSVGAPRERPWWNAWRDPASSWAALGGRSRASLQTSRVSSRRATGVARSGPSSTGCCSAGSTATGSRSRPRQVRRALLELAGRSGFWEHYSPVTGRGSRRRELRLDGRARAGRPRYGDRDGRKNDEEDAADGDAAQDGHADGKGCCMTRGETEMDDVNDTSGRAGTSRSTGARCSEGCPRGRSARRRRAADRSGRLLDERRFGTVDSVLRPVRTRSPSRRRCGSTS